MARDLGLITMVAEVEREVAEIEERGRWDDRAAHSHEDGLHQAVLRAIADGTAEDPQTMAAAALRTADIDFARWYA